MALPLETANAGGDLLSLGIDASEEHRLAVGQLVHSLERDVEARPGVVYREHVDRLPVVGELPTGATLVRVPARDYGSATDVGEVGERAEGGKA